MYYYFILISNNKYNFHAISPGKELMLTGDLLINPGRRPEIWQPYLLVVKVSSVARPGQFAVV